MLPTYHLIILILLKIILFVIKFVQEIGIHAILRIKKYIFVVERDFNSLKDTRPLEYSSPVDTAPLSTQCSLARNTIRSNSR